MCRDNTLVTSVLWGKLRVRLQSPNQCVLVTRLKTNTAWEIFFLSGQTLVPELEEKTTRILTTVISKINSV